MARAQTEVEYHMKIHRLVKFKGDLLLEIYEHHISPNDLGVDGHGLVAVMEMVRFLEDAGSPPEEDEPHQMIWDADLHDGGLVSSKEFIVTINDYG